MDEQREWNTGGKKDGEKEEEDEGSGGTESVDRLLIYRQILSILQPGESVLKVPM